MNQPSLSNYPRRRLNRLAAVISLTIVLAACSRGGTPTAAPPVNTAPPVEASPTGAGGPPAAPPAATTPARVAKIAEIINLVEARPSANEAWAAAVSDQIVPAGGEVQTKAASTARLDLSEGTVVRLGANTHFRVEELDQNTSDPFTRLFLEAGRIFIELTGGSMEVETPSGIAAVRGSKMSVSYDPVTGIARVTCLEGTCTVTAGGQTIILKPGEAVELKGIDQPPGSSEPMSQEDFDAWQAANPNLQIVPTDTQPPPTATNTQPPPPPPTFTSPPPTETQGPPPPPQCVPPEFFDPFLNRCRPPDPTNTPAPPPTDTPVPEPPYGGGFAFPTDGGGTANARLWIGLLALGALVLVNVLTLVAARRRSRAAPTARNAQAGTD